MQPEDWHFHYTLQARWLLEQRRFLYRKVGLARRSRILDFGCGTGVITHEMAELSGKKVSGVDQDAKLVEFAKKCQPQLDFRYGNELTLHKQKLTFDLVTLSFVLLWQKRPAAFLRALSRLLDRNGTLLILAEPDYGGRIDCPESLADLKNFYSDLIRQQGGDPFVGRKIAPLLEQAGYQAETGAICHFSALSFDLFSEREWVKEWTFWEKLSGQNLQHLKTAERKAMRRKNRWVLWPIFYAIAAPQARK